MITELLLGAGAVAAAAGSITYATLAPTCNVFGRVTARGPADSKSVALTFDDGPTPGTTDAVLDALQKHDAKATFFVIGNNVRQAPDLLRRIHADGHAIGNHTLTHSHYGFFRGPRFWRRELEETDAIIEQTIGQKPTLFRPPMGIRTPLVFVAVNRNGHRTITWSLRGMDGLETTPERILARFENITGGDIIVMHDGTDPQVPHRSRSAAGKAVGPLIERIRGLGLEPVRLDALLA